MLGVRWKGRLHPAPFYLTTKRIKHGPDDDDDDDDVVHLHTTVLHFAVFICALSSFFFSFLFHFTFRLKRLKMILFS